MAVRAGGKGDAREGDRLLWSNTTRGGIGTPIVHDGLVYSISGGVATCLDAETGESVYEKRLEGPAEADADASAAPDRGFGRAGDFARGGGFRQQDYSSPVLADGKLYYLRRGGEAYVLAAGREYKPLAMNKFASDDGDFSATPAVSDGELFIRSSNKLYCVGQ